MIGGPKWSKKEKKKKKQGGLSKQTKEGGPSYSAVVDWTGKRQDTQLSTAKVPARYADKGIGGGNVFGRATTDSKKKKRR
jgi:hypothetical protein